MNHKGGVFMTTVIVVGVVGIAMYLWALVNIVTVLYGGE